MGTNCSITNRILPQAAPYLIVVGGYWSGVTPDRQAANGKSPPSGASHLPGRCYVQPQPDHITALDTLISLEVQ
jgi:hypothetical protein